MPRRVGRTRAVIGPRDNPAGAAELYGLVVGVDDYVGTANDLDGAVNDANDVAQALHRLGAREVIRL